VNQREAVQLVSYLNRAGLVPALEGQAAVWADALGDVAFEDAQEVARGLARSRTGVERWVTPGDIRAGVRDIRRARLRLNPPPVPEVDPDDTRAYLAAYKAQAAGIAAGARQIGA
jgi:hypothetical protein